LFSKFCDRKTHGRDDDHLLLQTHTTSFCFVSSFSNLSVCFPNKERFIHNNKSVCKCSPWIMKMSNECIMNIKGEKSWWWDVLHDMLMMICFSFFIVRLVSSYLLQIKTFNCCFKRR
jgi:hypothetical protein